MSDGRQSEERQKKKKRMEEQAVCHIFGKSGIIGWPLIRLSSFLFCHFLQNITELRQFEPGEQAVEAGSWLPTKSSQ